MLKRIIAVAAVLVMTTAWAQAQEVKVGVALPYTGIGAEFAQQVDRGMELFMKLNPDAFGPCKVEIPEFVELYDQYKDKGLVIVGVSVDDSPEQLQAFMKEYKMNYPVLQMTPAVETAYGPFYGYPTTFFIARDGSICIKHLGPATKEQFEKEIKALL